VGWYFKPAHMGGKGGAADRPAADARRGSRRTAAKTCAGKYSRLEGPVPGSAVFTFDAYQDGLRHPIHLVRLRYFRGSGALDARFPSRYSHERYEPWRNSPDGRFHGTPESRPGDRGAVLCNDARSRVGATPASRAGQRGVDGVAQHVGTGPGGASIEVKMPSTRVISHHEPPSRACRRPSGSTTSDTSSVGCGRRRPPRSSRPSHGDLVGIGVPARSRSGGRSRSLTE